MYIQQCIFPRIEKFVLKSLVEMDIEFQYLGISKLQSMKSEIIYDETQVSELTFYRSRQMLLTTYLHHT